MTSTDPVGCFEAQLPAQLESVVAARRLVEGAVKGWSLGDGIAADCALTVSELVTNSVLHAGTTVGVVVKRLGRGVRIEVADGNPHMPVVDVERPEDLLENRSMTGRGLALVAATADRWGSDPVPGGGKVTWAEIGTGRRIVASSPPPSFPPMRAAPELTSDAQAVGITSATALAAGGRRVHLIGVPVQLLIDSTRNFLDLQREMQVMALDHSGPVELNGVVETGRAVTAEIDPWTRYDREVVEAAVARGDVRVDYDFTVPDDALDAMERLTSWLRRVRSAIVDRYLLTMPPTDEVNAYRRWYRDEVLAQLAGRAPQPCPLEIPKV